MYFVLMQLQCLLLSRKKRLNTNLRKQMKQTGLKDVKEFMVVNHFLVTSHFLMKS